jgi:DNA-binding transcriptional ArsR family regulator
MADIMTNWIEDTAKLLKVLGEPNRLGILFAIGKEERSVTEIIRITGLSQTLVSFHLRALREAGIVKTRRQGPFIYYSLCNPELIDLLGEVRKTAETESLSIETTAETLAGR